MPFKSQKQRGWMYENKPKLAKEFEAATPEDAKLPKKVNMAEGGIVEKLKKDIETDKQNQDSDANEGQEGLNISGAYNNDESDDKMQLSFKKRFSNGGEVKEGDDFQEGIKSGVNHDLNHIKEVYDSFMQKHQLGTFPKLENGIKEDYTVNSSTKNYAGGGEVNPIPPLNQTMQAVNQTPDTNYDFYGNVGADQRKALYDQLLQKQTSGGNMLAQAAGGIGDAISNSFGGQHNKFQDETRGIAEQNTANRIGAFDTQRAQKLQDMQGNQEMIMNDPKHPIAEAMRSTLKGFGVNVPSGMPAGIMLKVAGPMGELALKQATVAIQQGQAEESVRHNKVDETNTATAHTDTQHKQLADIADKEVARRENAAKGLQERPWYQKAVETLPFTDSDATKEMRAQLKQPSTENTPAPTVMTATNSMGHKITSKDGGQTWE